MDDQYSIRLENVCKTFKPRLRYSRHDQKSKVKLLLTLLGSNRSFAAPGAMSDRDGGGFTLNSINVSFKRASVIGIGGNGKSVLLRMIAGLTPLSSGVIRICGKLVKLLDIDDLDQNLTANDVFLDENTAKRASKDGQLRMLLEFAGLENFADVPISKFSTGMKLRLAMASVLCRDADVILIDDYYAVGDLEFQRKCHERIRERAIRGTTVIITSNDENLLSSLCDEVHWLENGTIIASGPPEKVFSRERSDLMELRKKSQITCLSGPVENHPLRLIYASVGDVTNEPNPEFSLTAPLRLRMGVEALADIDRIWLAFTLYNRGKQVLRTVLRDRVALARGCRIDAEVDLPGSTLAVGPHDVELIAQAEFSGNNVYIRKSGLSFIITGQPDNSPWGKKRSQDPSVASPDFKWKCEPI